MSVTYLFIVAALAIAALLLLVMRLKWPAYVALLAVSVATAAAAGIPIDEIVPTVIAGMGGTLGSVALLVGLGAMLGGIIEKTGGAEVVATRAVQLLGKERLGPALLIASGLIAIPIFFDVGFIILVPIIFSFAKAAGHRSPVILGAPVAATMVFIHNSVPPHPGVTGSTALLRGDALGLVTMLGIALAVPIGVVIYLVSNRLTRQDLPLSAEVRRTYDSTGAADFSAVASKTGQAATALRKPRAWTVVAMILLPILMISFGTIVSVVAEEGCTFRRVASFVGAPGFALIVAVVLAMWVLGRCNGWPQQEMSALMDAALGPAAVVVFVTGAGGVFAKVLTESGIGEAVAGLLMDAGVPILFMAFLVALVFKVAQGSGTVATLAAAGLMQSAVETGGYTDFQVALIILAIGMGSVSLSHINDSGFWISSRLLGLSVAGGLRTWTVLCTVGGFLGMAIISLLWLVA
ncbi:gluconate:H+ symporter [Actinomyces faecalis]|uniref:GntT/GntP/DsdX family permease n=1 Tax=Actinomyces faecalis TaxID=2722820 RepID=UPI0015523F2A|nr:gluconate:H+ symporter [Actinomyces faecalis]